MKLTIIAAGLVAASAVVPLASASAQRIVVHHKRIVREEGRHHPSRRICDMRYRHHHRVRVCRVVPY